MIDQTVMILYVNWHVMRLFRQAAAVQGAAGGDKSCAEEIEVIQKNKVN